MQFLNPHVTPTPTPKFASPHILSITLFSRCSSLRCPLKEKTKIMAKNTVVLLTRRIKWKGKYIRFSGIRDDNWSDIRFRTRVFRWVTACRSDSRAPPNSAMSHSRSLQNLSSTAATAFISRTFYFNLYHFRNEMKDKIWVDLGQECPKTTYFHFALF